MHTQLFLFTLKYILCTYKSNRFFFASQKVTVSIEMFSCKAFKKLSGLYPWAGISHPNSKIKILENNLDRTFSHG